MIRTFMYKLIWAYVLISVGHVSRSGIAGLYGKSMFNLLKNCNTILQGSCTNFHAHEQYMRVPIFPHFHQHMLLSVFIFSYSGDTFENESKHLLMTSNMKYV